MRAAGEEENCMRTVPKRIVYILVTLLAISFPLQSAAQNHQRYRLYDLGPGTGIGGGVTFGKRPGRRGGWRTNLYPEPLRAQP